MKRRFSLKNQTEIFHASKSLAVIFVLLLSMSAFARTLAEYQNSVKIAKDSADELGLYFTDAETDGEKDVKYERELIELIRTNIPATEKIEHRGFSVETGNKWLAESIGAFEKETDPVKRTNILSAIDERLTALQKKLSELEGTSASNRSKDEDKQKLSEILKREEFQKPEEQEESFIDRILKRIAEWFQRNAPQNENIPNAPPEGLRSISVVLQILLYTLLIGVIGFLLYKFTPFFFNKYKRREKREKKERVILGEKIAADEAPDTIFDEAERLAREGNLRGAIRKGYIALLCELSDRKIIGLAQHKTNRDYLRDTRKQPEIYKNMDGLTDTFERHWYGFEAADEADWSEFRQKYKQTVES
jgi:Domain of unknown function (DUF4129)